MTCRKRLEKMFREENVKFKVVKHEEAWSAQRLAGLLHIPGGQLAKVVIVQADDRWCMLVLPAPNRLDMPQVKRVLKAKEVRLAKEEEFSSLFPDCDVGAMPPFGNLYGVPVYVDRALTMQSEIAFPAGSHHEVMQVAYADFERTAQPVTGEFSTL